MKKIKKNDEVIIIAGKGKGNTGKVISVDGDRVFVAGQKMVTKHVKPNPTTGDTGGKIQKESAIHVSNVMLVEEGKPVKVGFRVEDGKKVRVSKKTDAKI